MNAASLVRLVLLGMIWGSSFLFMRIAVPAVGAGATTAARLALAALALYATVRVLGIRLDGRRRWRDYVLVGALNSALPFFFFAYAASYIPAGHSAVMNSTVPLFTVLLTWASTRLTPSLSKLSGVALGVAGVALLVGGGSPVSGLGALSAYGAVGLAALCYAISAVQIRRRFAGTEPLAVATGSLIAATAMILPPTLPTLPTVMPATLPLIALVMLGLVCTGLAYALYFRLLRDVGSERGVTVTLLVPVFAQLWGLLFLGEPITLAAAAGCALVLFAVALVFEWVRFPGRAPDVPALVAAAVIDPAVKPR